MDNKIKYYIAIVLICAAMIFGISRVLTKNNQPSFFDLMGINQSSQSNQPIVRINSLDIKVEVAADDVSREKGLSGRPSLGAQGGMLFVFDKPEIPTFWMPDMKFPIDIIWINNNKVVDISPNVSNVFDPQNPNFYEPGAPAQYVLEVNAGFCESNGINVGDAVSLINIK